VRKRIQATIATVLFLAGVGFALEARALACGGDGDLCGFGDIGCLPDEVCVPESLRFACGECSNGLDCVTETGTCRPGAAVCICSTCGTYSLCHNGGIGG